MDINDYSWELDKLQQPTVDNLMALGKWTEEVALPWLWDELGGAILTPKQKHPMARTPPVQSKLKPMKDQEAVRQGLITSAAEQNTKPAEPSFYTAQLTMLDSEARRYCSSIAGFAKATAPFAADATVDTLHRALFENMRVVRALLEDAGRDVAGVPGYFAAFRRSREHPFEVFKGAEKVIYGTYSGMTHADRAPYAPVAVLRTAIELRLRHAFCVYGFTDSTNQENLIPIDMSKLFVAIQERQSEIDFAVDVHDIWKIYRWSNFYLHGGVRDFPWVPGFVLQYLRPVFADQRIGPNGAWNINGGIRMSRETWGAVRDALQPRLEKPNIKARLSNAWRALLPGKSRQLILPAAEEKAAQCQFLN